MIQEGLAGPRGSQIHQQINTKTIRGKHRILDWFWMNLNNVYLRLVGSGASTIFPKPMNKLVVFFVVFIFYFTFELRVELHKPFAYLVFNFTVKLTQGVLQRLLHQFCRCLQIIGALGFTFSQKDVHSEQEVFRKPFPKLPKNRGGELIDIVRSTCWTGNFGFKLGVKLGFTLPASGPRNKKNFP